MRSYLDVAYLAQQYAFEAERRHWEERYELLQLAYQTSEKRLQDLLDEMDELEKTILDLEDIVESLES